MIFERPDLLSRISRDGEPITCMRVTNVTNLGVELSTFMFAAQDAVPTEP